MGGEPMLELLIIADDFTGALDTGVQFAGEGAETRVVTDRNYDYCAVEAGIQVLVMDAETRHLPAKEAYDVVYGIAIRGIASGIPYIYKKTDSALRGNIGSELTALLAASEKNILPFFPAFPKIGRTTEAGYHYINGIPVKESVFGQDPYDPVKCSYKMCIRDRGDGAYRDRYSKRRGKGILQTGRSGRPGGGRNSCGQGGVRRIERYGFDHHNDCDDAGKKLERVSNRQGTLYGREDMSAAGEVNR